MLLSHSSSAKCTEGQGCHTRLLQLSSGRLRHACLLRSRQSERHSSRAVRKQAHTCLAFLHQQWGPGPRLYLHREVQRLPQHPALLGSRQADRHSLSGGRRLAHVGLACLHMRTGQQACLQLSPAGAGAPLAVLPATIMCTLACSLAPFVAVQLRQGLAQWQKQQQ